MAEAAVSWCWLCYPTETDDDATLGQKDLNEASGAQQTQHDKQTLKFLARVREHPSQVLRWVCVR